MAQTEDVLALLEEASDEQKQIAASLTLSAAMNRGPSVKGAGAASLAVADYRFFLRLLLNKDALEAEAVADAEAKAAKEEAKAEEARAAAEAKAEKKAARESR